MNARADVCVVGGGPAGATLAARLATLGHEVVVVERQRFPREHVGESLSPAVWPVLDTLGVSEHLAGAGCLPTTRARVRWRGSEESQPVAGGLTVDRAAFDALLLDRARAAGATVLEDVHARTPTQTAEGWSVPLGDRVLRTRFLADASGRRRLLGGRRTWTAPRTLALHAVWCPGLRHDGAETRIEALTEGWLWGAHLPGGGFRAMAFVNPDTLAADGRDAGRLLRRLLDTSELFADLAGAQPVGRVHACDATAYTVSAPIDPTTVKVGEAAFAIDPLSSCGVQTAIQTGLSAAAAVHTIITRGGDTDIALEYYADQQRHAVRRHAATAAALYADHTPRTDAAFWRSRSVGAERPTQAPPGPALTELLPRRVQLEPCASIVPTPCLVDDRIERRRALSHPGLARPVAYLGDTELAPLLEHLPAAQSLASAVAVWDQSLPRGRARQLAAWLCRHGLLQVAPTRPMAAVSHDRTSDRRIV